MTADNEFTCYQSQDVTQVVHTDGSGAAVTVSRAVGSPRARMLMRLCNAVLNGDLLEAQRELDAAPDQAGGSVTAPDRACYACHYGSEDPERWAERHTCEGRTPVDRTGLSRLFDPVGGPAPQPDEAAPDQAGQQ